MTAERHYGPVCPTCGPFHRQWGQPIKAACPVCGMDEGEHAMRSAVMSLGGAEVYRREHRRSHGLRP